jgi:hypothetical protein
MVVAMNKYLAGFFDGEGHIIAYKSGPAQRFPKVVVGVTNTDERPLLIFQKRFGGHIQSRDRSKNGKIYKKQYAWTGSGQAARKMLAAIAPHLIVKREKAEAAGLMIQLASSAEKLDARGRRILKGLSALFGDKVYIDNPARHAKICIVCSKDFNCRKKSRIACSRSCAGVYRESQKREGRQI